MKLTGARRRRKGENFTMIKNLLEILEEQMEKLEGVPWATQDKMPPRPAVQAATEYLGLEWPVEIYPLFAYTEYDPDAMASITNGPSPGRWWNKQHVLEYGYGGCDTVWHELIHAQQAERLGGMENFLQQFLQDSYDTYRRFPRDLSTLEYAMLPLEREAIEGSYYAPFPIFT